MTSTFYPPYHIGGDANHVKYLAEELVKLGHEVHVFYSKDAFWVKKQQSLQIPLFKQGLLVHKYESPLNLSPYVAYLFGNFPSIQKAFKTIVAQIRPDIVHHHNISLLGYNILNRFDSYSNIYTAHDYWLICPQNNLLRNGVRECNDKKCIVCALKRRKPPQLWRYNNTFKKTISNIDLIISPSKYLQQRLSQELDIRSTVIHNFAPLPPENIPKHNLSDYFLFVGSLEERKGIMNLLEIYRKLRGKIGTGLLIVGSGSLKSRIETFIQRNSLNRSVIFMGAVAEEKLYSLYQSARALLVPSTWPENAPLVALEALSVGTPVISSNTGGLPEIVGKVDKKLIFNSIGELEHLLSSFHKNNIASSKIKKVYEENFSPKAFVNKYIDTINRISR